MFFIKLMLIILLNETFAYVTQSDIETVILPAWKPTGRKKILTLKAFGKQITLKLYRNDQTTSSAYKTWKNNAKDKTELLHLNTSDFCYYHHNDHISSAVINFCQDNGWEGLIFLEDETLEIISLRDDFASMILTDNFCVKRKTNISFGKLHRIRRSVQLFANSNIYNMNFNNFKQKRQVEDTQKKLTIELAVFLDETAYRKFMPILDEDIHKLRNMILAYVNNIEAVFHHPSLGVPIDISLVYFEFMDKQPSKLPLTNNSDALLTAFCKYTYARRPLDDNNRLHWDIALLLTGLDLYWLDENQEENYKLMGLSLGDGVCDMSDNSSCALVEFGADGDVTSGFASSLVAVHEIGHVLGIDHDEDLCNFSINYIMSPFKFSRGQLTWSPCSRNVSEYLWDKKECLRDRTTLVSATHLAKNHSQYNNLPGREWNAKAQCEIYFRDKGADVVSLVDICQTLQCKPPNNQHNFTGSALEGTRCAHEKECRGGECLPIDKPPYIFSNYDELYLYKDNWSEWKEESCRSSCLEKSKGVVIKRRFCTHGGNKTVHCTGLYYDVDLCDDYLLCANKSRLTVFDYSEKTCIDFTSEAKQLNALAANQFRILPKNGTQASHIIEEPWVACAIFCTKYIHYTGHSERTEYYASSLEMAYLDIDPYFPDGTWCHYQDGQDYYCRQHYCLPENYSFNSREVV